jgi:hypothetical protein
MPKPRKSWSALSARTKAERLRQGRTTGLTPAQTRGRYNAGTLGPSPRTARRVNQRERVEAEVIARKVSMWGDTVHWRGDRSVRRVKGTQPGKTKGKLPSVEKMQQFLNEGESIFDSPDFDWSDDDWDFLRYH